MMSMRKVRAAEATIGGTAGVRRMVEAAMAIEGGITGERRMTLLAATERVTTELRRTEVAAMDIIEDAGDMMRKASAPKPQNEGGWME